MTHSLTKLGFQRVPAGLDKILRLSCARSSLTLPYFEDERINGRELNVNAARFGLNPLDVRLIRTIG